MKLPLKIRKKNEKGKPEETDAKGTVQFPGVVTVWSPQSTGKSVLSGSLANALASKMPQKRICLVDFDMYTPAFSSDTDLNKTAKAIFEGDFDADETAKSVTPVKGFDNLYCLGGLSDILSMDLFTRENVKELLDGLTCHFDHLVIDTGREINLISTLMAFYAAEKVVMPVTGKAAPLRHARRYLDILENGLNLEREKIEVVLNQYEKHEDGFSVDDIKKLLQRPVQTLTYNAKVTETEIFTNKIDRQVREHLLSLVAPKGFDNNEQAKKAGTKPGLKRAERADNLGSC